MRHSVKGWTAWQERCSFQDRKVCMIWHRKEIWQRSCPDRSTARPGNGSICSQACFPHWPHPHSYPSYQDWTAGSGQPTRWKDKRPQIQKYIWWTRPLQERGTLTDGLSFRESYYTRKRNVCASLSRNLLFSWFALSFLQPYQPLRCFFILILFFCLWPIPLFFWPGFSPGLWKETSEEILLSCSPSGTLMR